MSLELSPIGVVTLFLDSPASLSTFINVAVLDIIRDRIVCFVIHLLVHIVLLFCLVSNLFQDTNFISEVVYKS